MQRTCKTNERSCRLKNGKGKRLKTRERNTDSVKSIRYENTPDHDPTYLNQYLVQAHTFFTECALETRVELSRRRYKRFHTVKLSIWKQETTFA